MRASKVALRHSSSPCKKLGSSSFPFSNTTCVAVLSTWPRKLKEAFSSIGIQTRTKENHVQVAQKLLEHRANPGVCLADGTSPADLASDNGNLDMLKLLRDHEADAV